MNTKIITAIMLCVLAITASAHTRKSRKKKAAPAPTSATMIKMHRTACFGRCPQYDVTVYASGIVVYHGLRFTEHDGTYQKNVGKAAATELINSFAAQRLDTCSKLYDKMIPDLPGLWYYYTLNGKSGEVGNAEAGPMWLRSMATKVDQLAKVDDTWKKTADAKEE